MEIVRLILAILTVVVTIMIFVIELQRSKKEDFFNLYASFIANENAQKASRIIENGEHEKNLSDDNYLIQLDQFLMYINALLCLADSKFIKERCLSVIKFELGLIKGNAPLCKDINLDENAFDALKEYINGKIR